MNNLDENQLVTKANHLVSSFEKLDLYIEFMKVKNAVLNNQYLTKLNNDRLTIQKNLKFYQGKKKEEALNLARELDNEYNSSPLITNYLNLKKEIEDLLYMFLIQEF